MEGRYLVLMAGIKVADRKIPIDRYDSESAIKAFLSNFPPIAYKDVKKFLIVIDNDDFIYVGHQCGSSFYCFRVDNVVSQ